MNSPSPATMRLTVWVRCGILVLAIFLVVLLGIAAWLEPAREGFGTHQGLGLPRCTVIELFGFRCPSCGMTTAWAHLVRGNLLRSLQANVGGTALGLLATLCIPWLLVSGVRGEWWLVRPNEWTLLVTFLVVFVITLIDWSLRLQGWL